MLRQEGRVHCFWLIWAATSLVHRLAFSSWFDSTLGWIATAGSVALVVAPRSMLMLALFLVTNSIYLLDILPNVANHLLFEAILNSTLLIALAACCWHARGGADPVRLLTKFSPVVRTQLLLLYGFAVLHKLNWDFFDPAVSCGSEMFEQTVALWLPSLTVPAWTQTPVILLTVLSEAGIALLLAFRSTRHMGIAVGLVFHALLALHPNIGIYSFSAMLYGLYALFLSDSASAILQRVAERAATKFIILAIFVGTTVWQQIATRGMDPYQARFRESEQGFYAWAAFSLALAAGYGFAMWQSRRVASDSSLEAAGASSGYDPSPGFGKPRLLWLMLIPVVITGASPYIGLKTQGTFSMFSNLRTEGSSNHLFLQRFDLFPYQSDIVSISGTSHAGLASWAARQPPMTYFEFRKIASSVASSIEDDIQIDFIRNGQRRSARKQDAGGEGAEIFRPHPWWTRKFLAFRRLPNPEKPMPCAW